MAALPNAITLYPQVPYVQLELTVAGNDVYWQTGRFEVVQGQIVLKTDTDDEL